MRDIDPKLAYYLPGADAAPAAPVARSGSPALPPAR